MKNSKKFKIGLISSVCSLSLINGVIFSSTFVNTTTTPILQKNQTNDMSTNSSYHTLIFSKDPGVAEEFSYVGSTTVSYRESTPFGSVNKPKVTSQKTCVGWYYYDDDGVRRDLIKTSTLVSKQKNILVYPFFKAWRMEGNCQTFTGNYNQSGQETDTGWKLYDYEQGRYITQGDFSFYIASTDYQDLTKGIPWLHCESLDDEHPNVAMVTWDKIPTSWQQTSFTFRIAYKYSIDDVTYGLINTTFYSDVLSFQITDGYLDCGDYTIYTSKGAGGTSESPWWLFINGYPIFSGVEYSLINKTGANGVSIDNQGYITWTKDCTEGQFQVQAKYNEQKYITPKYIEVKKSIDITTLWDEFIDPDRNGIIYDTESNWELLISAINSGLDTGYQIQSAIKLSKIYGYETFSWSNDYIAMVKLNNQLHAVRLIGLGEDELATNSLNDENQSNSTGKRALMTWEFMNLVSGNNGRQLALTWNGYDDPEYSYFNSKANELLNNEDDELPNAKWQEYNETEDTWVESETYKTSVYKMLQDSSPVLADNIQTIKRTVNIYSAGKVTRTFPTPVKLFLPTLANYFGADQLMIHNMPFFVGEGGSQYSRFKGHVTSTVSEQSCLIKQPVWNSLPPQNNYYYLASKYPIFDYPSSVWMVRISGQGRMAVSFASHECIAPCFCLGSVGE